MNARQLCKGLLGLMVAAAVTAGPAAAQDGVDVDLRAGFYTDSDAPAIGGGLLMNVGNSESWYFNPNLEMLFDDGDTDAALSGDFHYDFPTSSSVSPYLGVGPSIMFGDNDTDFGVNLLGGIAGKRGDVRPFGQLKAIVGGNEEIALMGGVRF